MIRVNLIGATKKKTGKASAKAGGPASFLPLVLVLIMVAFAAGGYLWYKSVTDQSTDLDSKIASATAQKAALDAVIKQNQIYENRKSALENRIRIIDGLKRNQVSPVESLDILSSALEKTQYVWLTQLEETGTGFNIAGIGTSVDAIADFVTNLKNTGYFRNPDLNNAQDSQGNFIFSLKCEYGPPRPAPATAVTPAAGGK